MFKKLFVSVMPFVLLVAIVQFCLGQDLNQVSWMTIWQNLQNCFKFDFWAKIEPFIDNFIINGQVIENGQGSFWDQVGALFSMIGQGLILPFYSIYAFIATIVQWLGSVGSFVGFW